MQAAYVSEKEVKKVVAWIKSKLDEEFEDEILKESLVEALDQNSDIQDQTIEGVSGQEDSLYEDARRIVIQQRKASASLLQRKLRIGYARAARLIDTLEDKGIVGPSRGAKPREVYLSDADEQGSTEEDDNNWQSV